MNNVLIRKFVPYIVLFIGVIYGIWPIDAVPDVPIVGWVDDFGVIGAAILIFLLFYLKRKNKNTKENHFSLPEL
ncbi:MAG: DUF1232 domain-containing protein [Patescibacteria group bacterium]|nr:DUF1232 domain-containing protein [Patescibacteria group bacterium]